MGFGSSRTEGAQGHVSHFSQPRCWQSRMKSPQFSARRCRGIRMISGKKRLIEALQAAAEDPLFKSVLQIVQAEFDKAFASSGQRRRGKDSPWIKVRDQIRLAEEDERQCREQLQKTTSIESELQELLSRRLECESVLAKAIETLQSAEADYNQAIKRAEIVLRIHGCQDRLHEITSAIQKLADAKSRHTELFRSQRGCRAAKGGTTQLADKAGRVDAAQEDIRIRSVRSRARTPSSGRPL